MKIFPAIDLKGGKVVRLLRGDYGCVTEYAVEPVEAARAYRDAGAEYLHIVDLDGAKDGCPANFDLIAQVVSSSGLFVEVGGGIRDEERVEAYLSCGVSRVILGTAAVRDVGFRRRMVKKYGEKIAVGVDARDGRVAVEGWRVTTELSGPEFCRVLRDEGVHTVIYTDIARDGAMMGSNLPLYRELLSLSGLEIIASGGVTSMEDVRALKEMGVPGVIIGKALYTGAIDLREAIEATAC